MIDFGVVSYAAATLAFFILSLLLLTSWLGRLQGALLVIATVASTLWAVVIAITGLHPARQDAHALVITAELVRDASWLVFLLGLLNPVAGWRWMVSGRSGVIVLGIAATCGCLLIVTVTPLFTDQILPAVVSVDGRLLGHIVLAVAGLALIEQLFRNTLPQSRWAIKYLCLGVGGIFAYDFYLYANALLFKQIDHEIWNARGLINALIVPLIAVSAARNPEWSLDVFVSRHIVFHTVAVLGAGAYLLAMAVGGIYIRSYGGTWGNVAQIIFLFGSLLVLLMLMFSGQLQAKIKVFVSKHFFNYKFDYREEWLRFIRTLSAIESGPQLRERAIEAIVEIVDSPGGGLWLLREQGRYEAVTHWNMPQIGNISESWDGSLATFLEEREWVINIDEYEHTPEMYSGLELPAWLHKLERAWLVVPLMHHDGLLGFVVVARPRVARSFNWEDSDLLKTAGRQAASHLAQLDAAEALVNARQFEAVSRLSAFMMHDLKNVVAQLSLVVANAARHKNNPEFMDDAIRTVDNAVGKMNHLLGQLRSGDLTAGRKKMVALEAILREVISLRASSHPIPVLHGIGRPVLVMADEIRLSDVLGHIIQNAQEATPSEGRIDVRLQCAGNTAVIEVQDTGCGMDARFIRERLFRPFDSTKGKSGMGIGAYETREYIRELGGDVDVESEPGRGTLFRIKIPRLPDFIQEARTA